MSPELGEHVKLYLGSARKTEMLHEGAARSVGEPNGKSSHS